jgi:hypothetical protein
MDVELARARDGALGRDVDLPVHFAVDLALARARDLGRNLDATETLSLLLSGLSKPESDSAAGYVDLLLAAALALEQQAGNIPPLPVGIALVRRKVK